MNLIDKDTLVAEIEKLKHRVDDRYSYSSGWKDALLMVEAKLDTIDVKEVDLKQSYREYINKTYNEEFAKSILDGNIKGDLDNSDLFGIMSYGFELSLKVQNFNSKCEDLRDDGICNYATTKLGRTICCENISCSRRNKAQKGEMI